MTSLSRSAQHALLNLLLAGMWILFGFVAGTLIGRVEKWRRGGFSFRSVVPLRWIVILVLLCPFVTALVLQVGPGNIFRENLRMHRTHNICSGKFLELASRSTTVIGSA
jgi:hypothetical protein